MSFPSLIFKSNIFKSIFKSISIGDIINLERSLLINSRLDGHIVQGHVDEMINCIEILENKDDWVFTFQFSKENKKIIVEKGSVTINGVSLTCYNVRENQFSVSIIPHTFKKTNFQLMNMGYNYNIEYDILGKYINKLISKDSIK